jgi:hypothetical protein
MASNWGMKLIESNGSMVDCGLYVERHDGRFIAGVRPLCATQ